MSWPPTWPEPNAGEFRSLRLSVAEGALHRSWSGRDGGLPVVLRSDAVLDGWGAGAFSWPVAGDFSRALLGTGLESVTTKPPPSGGGSVHSSSRMGCRGSRRACSPREITLDTHGGKNVDESSFRSRSSRSPGGQ